MQLSYSFCSSFSQLELQQVELKISALGQECGGDAAVVLEEEQEGGGEKTRMLRD